MPLPPIYLDNAATTRVAPEVAAVVEACMLEDFANPASAHHAGIAAEKRVGHAQRQLLGALGDPDASHGEIYWTSGGTESDALGVLGAARARARISRRVVVSAVEHPAVRESARLLRDEGFEVEVIGVTRAGLVDVDRFLAATASGAAVAALMLVQNEIGTVQPVAEIARRLRDDGADVHLHCDAVQALGKLPIDIVELGADSVAFAAHKLHGPKGVGALWLRRGARIVPLWAGGGQQVGLRSGTHNVPGIAGFGAAVDLAQDGLIERRELFASFADTLLEACQRANLRFSINGDGAPRAGHVLSLAFADCPAEPLLHVLESRGVLVSAGSACSERDRKPSPVLTALGVPESAGTIRLSFGRDTTPSQVDTAAEVLIDAVRDFQR